MNKADVRRLARMLGLSCWDKPAAPCLSSRIPYGEAITSKRLARVGSAEELIRNQGFRDFRVRDHGEIARLEIPVEELNRALKPDRREAIVEGLRGLGYQYVTLDMRGFRSGSLNEVLPGDGTD